MKLKMHYGAIRLFNIWTGALDGKVSIYCSNQGVVVAPYQEGDEDNTAMRVKEFDSRGRLIIPLKMRSRFGLDHHINVISNRDGTLLLLPDDEA